MDTPVKELLKDKIKMLYDIEEKLVEAIPKMTEAANTEELKDGLRGHLEETRAQVVRLERVFEILAEEPKKVESAAIRGLVEDGEKSISMIKEEKALDLTIIDGARAVEHYEMACYMAAHDLAALLGHTEAAELLKETLEEERMADKKLSALATTLGEELSGEDDTNEM